MCPYCNSYHVCLFLDDGSYICLDCNGIYNFNDNR